MNTRAGATNSAICVEEPIAISSVTSTLFRRANITADECSAAFPMIGMRIKPTKASESPSDSIAVSREPTRNSAISATSAVEPRRSPIALRGTTAAPRAPPGVWNRCSWVISVKASAAM